MTSERSDPARQLGGRGSRSGRRAHNDDLRLTGYVDGVRVVGADLSVHGWVFESTSRSTPVSVALRMGRRIVATGDACIGRPDLLDAGYGNISCGFDVRVPAALRPASLDVIVVSSTTTRFWQRVDVPSALTAETLTADDVRNVYRVLFLREPNGEADILGQLSAHATRSSFVAEMFASPETWATHTRLTALARSLGMEQS